MTKDISAIVLKTMQEARDRASKSNFEEIEREMELIRSNKNTWSGTKFRSIGGVVVAE